MGDEFKAGLQLLSRDRFEPHCKLESSVAKEHVKTVEGTTFVVFLATSSPAMANNSSKFVEFGRSGIPCCVQAPLHFRAVYVPLLLEIMGSKGGPEHDHTVHSGKRNLLKKASFYFLGLGKMYCFSCIK